MNIRRCITTAVWGLSAIAVYLLMTGSTPNSIKNSIGKLLPPDAAPPEQQVYHYLANEPTSLDITVAVYTADGSEFFFEALTVMDENNEVLPGAAERWEVADDGLSWTFYMRKDARWSDGHPQTAHDFEYALKRSLDPMSGNVYPFPYYLNSTG